MRLVSQQSKCSTCTGRAEICWEFFLSLFSPARYKSIKISFFPNWCFPPVFRNGSLAFPFIHKAVVSMKLSEHKPHNMAECYVKINSGIMWKSSYVNNTITELSCLPLSLSCASFKRLHFACARRQRRQSDVRLEYCWALTPSPLEKLLLHVDKCAFIPQFTQVMSGLGNM